MTLLYLSLPRILSILKTLHQLSERLAEKWLAQFNIAQLQLNEEMLAKVKKSMEILVWVITTMDAI